MENQTGLQYGCCAPGESCLQTRSDTQEALDLSRSLFSTNMSPSAFILLNKILSWCHTSTEIAWLVVLVLMESGRFHPVA